MSAKGGRPFRWTPEQTDAITSLEDTLLVANAGTGKTTTVVGKVLWHLGLGHGVDERGEPLPDPPETWGLEDVAAITFTEKAASDLKAKLRQAIERSERPELRWEVGRASIGTIHSFCGELLREHALRFGVDPTFEILDEHEAWSRQDRLIKDLVLDRLDRGDEELKALLTDMRLERGHFNDGLVDYVRTVMRDLLWHPRRYEAWRRRGARGDRDARAGSGGGEARGRWAPAGEPGGEETSLMPCSGVLDVDALRRAAPEWDPSDETLAATCDVLVGLALQARDRWKALQREENCRDFDALILDVRDFLRGPTAEAAAAAIRKRYRLLVIDEFQDTDAAQRDIAFAIARGVERPQLFLVGDPKQSIYRFRGADISVWNEVEDALREDGRVLSLSRNFRSAPPVVDFVNQAASRAMDLTGEPLDEKAPESRVRYDDLEVGRAGGEEGTAGVEWLAAKGASAAERRDDEARRIATRILQLVGHEEIEDPDTGERRPLELRDVAILYRTRTGLEHYEAGLTRYGIPYYLAGAPHLNERQEVLDVLNALRVVRFPRDDLRAFGYLRSPFVGLRDETIGRIRLFGGGGALLRQAERFLEDGDVWPGPDHPEMAGIERAALRRGLRVLDELRGLAPRVPLDELIEELLECTGYRLHLLLMDRADEALSNLQALIHFAENYRHLGIDSFLDVWDRWSRQDLGIPQAPLYSREDQVVTLTTIHKAKGLEWPVVFFVGLEKGTYRHRTNKYWSDRELGPLLCPKSDDRGARAQEIVDRDELEATAEEARLLYVALTRPRDVLVLVGPRGLAKGYGAWLEGEESEALLREPDLTVQVEPREVAAPPELGWLNAVDLREPPEIVRPLPEPDYRWTHSATELQLREEEPDLWKQRYRLGVAPHWEFAPRPREREGLPATARGTIIHGVLERIRHLEEVSDVLEEAIGGVDDPHVQQMLTSGSRYRAALEEEIRKVVESGEWRWYVDGEHWRELPFVHLKAHRDWRFGWMDLYRLVEEGSLVVDFKTHPVEDEPAARAVAAGYGTQVRVYRAAAELAGEAEVRLHFTRLNVALHL